MKLIGRNLSPYVRRVAIWCALQDREVEREPLAALDPAHAEALRAYNPGRRVPVLVLDDGTKLIETFAICDWLDETAPDKRLVPAGGEPRRNCLQRIAFATAATEKAVALAHETSRRPEQYHWPNWQERLRDQIRGTLDALDATAPEGWYGGNEPDGSDLAIVCAYQYCEVIHPGLLEGHAKTLGALAERAMAIPSVAETYPAL